MNFTDKNSSEYVDQLLNPKLPLLLKLPSLPKQDPIVEEFTYDIEGALDALEEETRLDREEKEYYQKYYAQCETQSYMLPDNFWNE